MLYQMLNKLNARINKIDPKAECPRFVSQLKKMRPGLKKDLISQGIAKDEIDKSITALSMAQLVIIKTIPNIANELAGILKSRNGSASFRCAVAASLAYLVNPNDLLPDNLPGAYGFIDDYLFLQEACALSWELAGDKKKAEERRKVFQFTFMFVPDGRRQEFQTAIDSLALTINLMQNLEPMIAEMTIQMLIQNPLQQMPQQTGSFGNLSPFASQFSGFSNSYRPQYSWRDGDKMGINFPGGGGVAADSSGVYLL